MKTNNSNQFSINQIQLSNNKKSMQYFLGKINLVRRFIPSFAKTIKPLQDMIKKDAEFKWGPKNKTTFEKIKKKITQAPTLMSLEFNRDFILYMFVSNITFVVVLTQKDLDGNEYPIVFMTSSLQGVELDYPKVEKQSSVIFKATKHFRTYLIKSKTKVIVPYPAVRNILVQKDLGEKRANRITTLQEYYLEIKPAKFSRDKGSAN